MNNRSPFVVDELRPQSVSGKAGGVYQLDANSVTPTRHAGNDDVGMPIEERVPICYSKKFVALSGGVRDVPMRTAAVFSMDPAAERYEQIITREIIKAGQLPLEYCPYSFEFKHITGGALVKVPTGETDCGGKPEGCIHMQRVIEKRLAASKAKWDADNARINSMKSEQVEALVEAIGMAAQRSDPKAAKARMREGRSDE